MTAAQDYPKRRQAGFHIGIPELASLIDLPEGARIAQLIPRSNPDGLLVIVESPSFDEVEHEAEVPYVHPVCTVATDDDTGIRYFRWSVK